MHFSASSSSDSGQKVNVLRQIPNYIAYSILLELNERELLQVRHTCPSWKYLLDRDEFWKMKLLKEQLHIHSVAGSSNIEEFVSYFKSRHQGIYRYFNRLKWNWEGNWFQQVPLNLDILEVCYIDEEVFIFKLPNIDNCNKGILIGSPATGRVLQQITADDMGAVKKVKKSGKYLVVEDSLHRLKVFNWHTNMVLSELQESSGLTHLKMFENLVVTITSNDSTIHVWNVSNGKTRCKFYDNTAHISVDLKNWLIATDNVGDRRVRIWNLIDGKLLHSNRVHSTAIIQILIQRDVLIVVECSGEISIKYWTQPNQLAEINFFGRPNSKVRRLDYMRFAYVKTDQVFDILAMNDGRCLQSIKDKYCIKKIKSNCQFLFILGKNIINIYDIKNYNFIHKIACPFKDNTLVLKFTESKLLFQKMHSDNLCDQFCLYNFAPRSLSEYYV